MLFLKMLRDLSRNKTQFLSIFLMAFLSMFVYAGIGGEWHGMNDTLQTFYQDTAFADAWIYGADFTDEDVIALRKINGITNVERRLSFETAAVLDDDPMLTAIVPESYEISRTLLQSGEEYDEAVDGIWLDDTFAAENNLSPGDCLSFSAMGITLEKEIIGTVLSPEYIYNYTGGDIVPDHSQYGFVYISPAAMPDDIRETYNTVLLTAAKGTDMDKLEDEIDKALDSHYSVYLERENHPSNIMISDEVEQHKTMANLFPFVFLAIAMLTILTTMTRIVNNQRTQIGTLKSMGYKRSTIVLHYVSYGFIVSLTGSLAGTLIGPVTLPQLFYGPMQTTFVLYQWTSSFHYSFIVVAVISSVICGLFTYLACRNHLQDTPAQTLRPKAPRVQKRTIFERSALWQKLGFNIQWNLRDIFRSKTRSLMAIAGVIGCMALLICAFGMLDSFNDILEWQYNDLNHYESKLTLDETASYENAASVSDEVAGEMLMEGSIEIKAGNIKKTADLLVYDELTLIHFTNPERKKINLPENGLAITYKLANTLGVEEGDEVTWHIYGSEGWKTAVIDTIYRSPVSQGITVSRQFFEDTGYEFLPTSIITSETVAENPDFVTTTHTAAALQETLDIMLEAMYVMVYVLIIAALLLAVVVLYNLGVLSFTERQKELATLKVLGFKSGKIRKLLLTQTTLLTVLGIIIGIFAGSWLLDFLIATVSESFDMMTMISPFTFAVSIGVSSIISVLVTLIFSRNVKKIDMVSSLKGVE